MPESTAEIVVTRVGARLDVLLNRPSRHNSFTPGMYAKLTELFTGLADDEEVRAVVLRGAGGAAFAAGNDISGFVGMSGHDATTHYEDMVASMLRALAALPQVSVAAVEGICVGGGLAVATHCDVRIATTDARFGYPIARTLGNALSQEVTLRCVHVFGESMTRHMLLTSRLVDARRAYELGAVAELASSAAELDAQLDELVAGIERAAPMTVQVTKHQLAAITGLDALGGRGGGSADLAEADLMRAVYDSAGFREGVRAFLAKERPAFPSQRLELS
ncbi:MAG: enoyl-CoA hydratase-related protein [Micrococcales bacterium]|nr:enoyl-CoA hydratase-related protein [Micrococcales bacterium]